jgi:hypothetical protein
MKKDKAFLTAMEIVGQRGDTEAYRDAVAAIARAIRREGKRSSGRLRRALREAVVVMEKYADWPSHNADLSAAVSNARAVLSEE